MFREKGSEREIGQNSGSNDDGRVEEVCLGKRAMDKEFLVTDYMAEVKKPEEDSCKVG
jgi:hypothetical protein